MCNAEFNTMKTGPDMPGSSSNIVEVVKPCCSSSSQVPFPAHLELKDGLIRYLGITGHRHCDLMKQVLSYYTIFLLYKHIYVPSFPS